MPAALVSGEELCERTGPVAKIETQPKQSSTEDGMCSSSPYVGQIWKLLGVTAQACLIDALP